MSISTGSSNTDFIQAANTVISRFNSLNSRLKFQIVPVNTNEQIGIIEDPFVDGAGRADFPKNGLPGRNVRINIEAVQQSILDGFFSGTLLQGLITNIQHELGHAVGLRHTDWRQRFEPRSGTDPEGAFFTATHLLGTPEQEDPSSIMNSGTTNFDFSGFDRVGLEFIYPLDVPSGTVPVFRYYKRSIFDHVYTTNFQELGSGINSPLGYIFEGIGFFAFPNQTSGTTEVHRLFNTSTGEHFYTASLTEKNSLLGQKKSKWVSEGVAFHSFPQTSAQGVPVHRFFSPFSQKYFYSKNLFEGQDETGFILEGTAFRAF